MTDAPLYTDRMTDGFDDGEMGLASTDEPMDPRAERDVSTRAGDGALGRVDAAKNEDVRRWDVTTPSATGRSVRWSTWT